MRDDVKHQAKVYHQAIQIENDFIYYMYVQEKFMRVSLAATS